MLNYLQSEDLRSCILKYIVYFRTLKCQINGGGPNNQGVGQTSKI